MNTADSWKGAVIYQVYPRSFADGNGDGIGDLTGLISRLDYIRDLGVDAVWISPFFKSPGRDHGYDITDFTSVDPIMGDMNEVNLLIEGCHKRGLKILFDMVLNHTSDQHPWFLKSRTSKDNPKRDWYIWRTGRGSEGEKPPNNWTSMTGGSGWHFDKVTKEWYWAQFLPFQPDLNWRNPDVKKAMFSVLRFWLDKGVDGFRLDIIGSIYEDAEFRDNPGSSHFFPTEESGDMLFRSSSMTRNLPDTFVLAKELRSLIDEYPDKFLIGEAYGSLEQLRALTGGVDRDGLNAVFLFKTLSVPFRLMPLSRLIHSFEEAFKFPFEEPVYVFSNHDRSRSRTRLGLNIKQMKMLTLLQLTLRGQAVIYYGEEIGLPDGKIPVCDATDPLSVRMRGLPLCFAELANRLVNGGLVRDRCRTPMPWMPDMPDGWLPYSADPKKLNIRDQEKDPDSILSWYRYLLSMRHKYPDLRLSPLEWITDLPGGVLGYRRGRFEILINFNSRRTAGVLPHTGIINGPLY